MEKIFIPLLALILVVVAFFMFAPEDRINAVSEYKRRVSKDPGQLCFDYTKKKLKDPDSARYVAYEKDQWKRIVIQYRAKNGYGAYVSGSDVCILDSDGKVEETLTNLEQQIEELNKRNATRR
jgi:hypothetical protein